MSINVGGLILEMQNEPEFDAWIRERELYPVAPRKVTSFSKVRMVVAVEDTPGLIVGAPLASLSLAIALLLGLNCALNEVKWNARLRVQANIHSLAVVSPPKDEVLLFSSMSLREYVQFQAHGILRDSALREMRGSASGHQGLRALAGQRRRTPTSTGLVSRRSDLQGIGGLLPLPFGGPNPTTNRGVFSRLRASR